MICRTKQKVHECFANLSMIHQLIVPELDVFVFPPRQTFLTVIAILPLTKNDVDIKLPGFTDAYWLNMPSFARLLRRAGEATLFLNSNQGILF